MILFKIDRNTLIDIHDLLNSSAGQEISIQDELSYFDSEKPKSWFVLKDVDGRNMGFVRSFSQGTDWSLGELYVVNTCKNRRQAARVLLESFASQLTLQTGHRLRFDVRATDLDLNAELIALGFSQKRQTFLHFQSPTSSSATQSNRPQWPSLSQASQVAEVLSF